jgi:ParB-like chromosome segregation protein Spo0J
VVIGGEQRTKVAGEDLGYEQVPCYEINLEFEQEKELNIRLNKNSGEWDFEALEHFFDVESLMDWGFKES